MKRLTDCPFKISWVKTITQKFTTKGRFTLRRRRPGVGQECLAKTWIFEANGGCAGEGLKAIKYLLFELGFSGGRGSCPVS